MNPLDDIFKEEEKPSIQQIEEKRLRVIFEWIVSFSVVFWSIAIVNHFGNDISILLKGILLIGIVTVIISSLFSLVFAFIEYKDFSFYTRFYHLWLLIMSSISCITIFISLYFIVVG